MSAGSILLTGGSGFIGQHVIRALHDTPGQRPLRVLIHDRPVNLVDDEDVEMVTADLAEPASLEGICAGITTVIHLASYIGHDVGRCDAVNGRGTEALVQQARAAGVARIVYLSNAAVYGYGVHRGDTEDDAIVAPATPISRSRARAELAVLEAGGSVLRPLFVYGDGDTRFLPAIMRALTRLPFLIDCGRARLSVVAVDDLAVVLARMATMLDSPIDPGAYHVTDGQPVTFGAIADALASTLGTRVPRWSVPYGLGRWLVRTARGGLLGDRRWAKSDDHRLFLVTHDHYYDDSKLRRQLPLPSSPSLPERLHRHAEWYARYTRTSFESAT
jgi:nucleoside-diphosphate-sugar epimerase